MGRRKTIKPEELKTFAMTEEGRKVYINGYNKVTEMYTIIDIEDKTRLPYKVDKEGVGIFRRDNLVLFDFEYIIKFNSGKVINSVEEKKKDPLCREMEFVFPKTYTYKSEKVLKVESEKIRDSINRSGCRDRIKEFTLLQVKA